MVIISVKANKKKIIGISFAIVLLLTLLVTFISCNTARFQGNAISTAKYLNSNTQRIEFLQSFGWEVSDEACEIVEVIIPSEFNDVYNNYNAIQKKQGYNLEDYKGKAVKRYTYEVLNYPGHEKNIRANLLLYGNKIIGGDICSIEIDGFMHGFKLEK